MSASVNQERERFEAWAQANGFGQSLPSTWAWQGWQAALSAGQATEPVGFIKEATEALLVEILDDDCDDLQSVRAIARTLRAALSTPSPLPAPVEPTLPRFPREAMSQPGLFGGDTPYFTGGQMIEYALQVLALNLKRPA